MNRRAVGLGMLVTSLASLTMGFTCGTEPGDACGTVNFVNDVSPGVISVTVRSPHAGASYILDAEGQQFVGQAEAGDTFIFSGLPKGTYSVTWWVSGCPDQNSLEKTMPGPNQITVT